MTDEELRQLVRASVERHLGQPTPPPPAAAQARVHSSHFHFAVPSGGDVAGSLPHRAHRALQSLWILPIAGTLRSLSH